MLLLFFLFYSLSIKLSNSVPKNYLKMIYDLPNWWSFITYYVFKSHMNVTDVLDFFIVEDQGWEVGGWEKRFQSSL